VEEQADIDDPEDIEASSELLSLNVSSDADPPKEQPKPALAVSAPAELKGPKLSIIDEINRQAIMPVIREEAQNEDSVQYLDPAPEQKKGKGRPPKKKLAKTKIFNNVGSSVSHNSSEVKRRQKAVRNAKDRERTTFKAIGAARWHGPSQKMINGAYWGACDSKGAQRVLHGANLRSNMSLAAIKENEKLAAQAGHAMDIVSLCTPQLTQSDTDQDIRLLL